jgi:predicted ATP-grasp superfamily ATP-dependent carboligase
MTKLADMDAVAQAKPRLEKDKGWLAGRTLSSSPGRQVREDVPVIILNLFYTGVGIARDLAGLGVHVVGLSAHPKIYGNFTRFCEVRRAPNSAEQPEALAEFLLRAAGELRGAVIFPTRDLDVLFLDRHRNRLEPYYRLAVPARDCLLRVLNKHALVEAAREAGVAVPRTLALRSGEELARVAQEVGFPCVVKPVSSYHWREKNNWETVGGRKAFLVTTYQELKREYGRVCEAHPEILVQEWIPGGAENVAVLGAYVGEDSEPLAWFTARKVVQSPDDFGTGCIVRSEPIPELFEPTLRLWRSLGYQGMAEVEYKRDSRTGRFLLIEMNTRHWDQHNLGRASGINLSLTAYRHLSGQQVVPVGASTRPATWIAEDALLFHTLRAMHRREFRLRRLWQQLARPHVYGIFSWNDPWPFVRYMFSVILPTVTKQAFRKLQREEGSS